MIGNALVILGFIGMSLEGQPAGGPSLAGGSLVHSRIEQRIVKTFDFDEPDNYDDEPKFWNKVEAPGHPWFLTPRFDFEVGHAAPPSFRLTLRGGSLAASYLAKDIPIHPNSDYQVTAWIRPDGLVRARAYVEAYFLDHAMRKIAASERRSRLIGTNDQNGSWSEVVVDLPGGVENAAWLGLACHVEQPEEAQPGHGVDSRPIHYRDVHAGAWFDDIAVIRLPNTLLTSGAVGSVFYAEAPIDFVARVADPDGVGLTARLDILDGDGTVVQTHSVPIVGVTDESPRVVIADVPAGRYTARLAVLVDEQTEIVHREQPFIRLNADPSEMWHRRLGGAPNTGETPVPHSYPTGGTSAAPGLAGRTPSVKVGGGNPGQGFGMIVDSSAIPHPVITKALLDASCVGVVKLPLWREDMTDEDVVRGEMGLDRLLRMVQDRGISVVATLSAPPTSLAMRPGVPRRSLLDVLAAPPDTWRPYFALMLARYGPRISAWQIGPDGGPNIFGESRMAAAVTNVRAELQPLIGAPAVAVPCSVLSSGGIEAVPAEILSQTVPAHIPADRLSEQLAATEPSEFDEQWVTVEVPPVGRYTRHLRLIQFSRRLVSARAAGIDTVFVRQPWTVGTSEGVAAAAPDEELILLRTLTQVLGDMEPIGSVWLDHGVRGWLFASGMLDVGAMVVWSEAQDANPRTVVADIGADARRIDLWANVTETAAAPGGRTFKVEAMPAIIAPVTGWKARMIAGFAVDDPTFRAAVQEHERFIVLTNPLGRKIGGVLRLQPPRGWRMRPRRLDVDLDAGQSGRFEVSFRVPSNEAVGETILLGRLDMENEDLGEITLRAPLYVRSPGLDVNVMTSMDGEVLRIVQRITNLTEGSLGLRTMLIAPDMPYESQVIRNLPAGKTTVREYRIDNAGRLTGRHIRVSVKQIGGDLQHNWVISLE